MSATKVIFLIKSGELFAFFPDIKEGQNLYLSYAHIGQHSSCHIDYAKKSKQAKTKDYENLVKELRCAGYKLLIVSKKYLRYAENFAEFNRCATSEIFQTKEYYYRSINWPDVKELRFYKKSTRVVSTKQETKKPNPINFNRIDNDVNGNPRYVCHFLNFIAIGEESNYNLALARAKDLGGRKFHNKRYGGGIVFQSYNIDELSKRIHELMLEYQINP